MYGIIGLAGFVLLAAAPAVAQAQPVALTFEQVLDRARQSAPAIVAARMRIEEVRGRVAGASLLLSTNPELELEAGDRTGETSSNDFALEIGQVIDLPHRRGARLAAARAAVAQEGARARDVERETLRAIATAFLETVVSRERAEAAASGKRLADEALLIAERRYAAGDVAQLDVNLARTAVARSDAEARSAAAIAAAHRSELQILLGIAEPVEVAGSLREALAPAIEGALPLADRPDLLLLDAEIAEAEAERRIAESLRLPDVGLRGGYAEEEGDRIVRGGIGVTLPLFQRGRQETAIASARLARLRTERDALARMIEAEVRGAAAAYEALRDAASEFERTVIPLIEENERLALESYQVGQIGLADLLLVRREALDARRSLIDQLAQTRLAEIALRARTGVWK